MGPDPTQPGPTLWPRYFLTQPEEIFLIRRENIEKFDIFRGGIFQIQTQTINGWPEPTRPDPSHKKLTRRDPGQKFLTRTHHLPKRLTKFKTESHDWNWDYKHRLGLSFFRASPLAYRSLADGTGFENWWLIKSCSGRLSLKFVTTFGPITPNPGAWGQKFISSYEK